MNKCWQQPSLETVAGPHGAGYPVVTAHHRSTATPSKEFPHHNRSSTGICAAVTHYLPALLLTLMFAGLADAATPEPRAIANTLLDQLDAGRFEQARNTFTPAMAQALPLATLSNVWRALPQQLGTLQRRGVSTQNSGGDGTIVIVPLQFERGALDAKISIDVGGRIAGLLLQPAHAPAPPAADADGGFSERAIEVAGLPGLLALPDGAGPFPAVVLVHGSGPQDLNETIGPNRPFLDIARGLAAQGIAVLRYDKRTHARPQEFADGRFDIDRETTDDAIAAIALLASTAGIDPRHLYVMGHSQGGMLAPRIATRSGKLAGVILWAAPARPMLDLLLEQNRYLLSLDGDYSAQDQTQVAAIQQQIGDIRAGNSLEATLLGAPAGYWREADGVDPVADLAKLDLPVLWLQGGRDYQVTAPDWTRWKQALRDNRRATLHEYPALNHLGIAGDTRSSPADYQGPGHVDAGLIADVAAWINASAGRAQR